MPRMHEAGKICTIQFADYIVPVRLGGEPLDIDHLQPLYESYHARKCTIKKEIKYISQPDWIYTYG